MKAEIAPPRDLCGWLNLDKPAGLGSTAALARVKKYLGARKAGHAGTLDPLASGVLPIALGAATKTAAYMMAASKRYQVLIAWGVATDSDDSEGEITARSPVRPSLEEVAARLPDFTGIITQTPPQFSALRVGGQRAYKLARAGTPVTPEARQVEIAAIRIVDAPDRDHLRLEVDCGKGVYIRALARDLGLALGTYGHVAALRRVCVGKFHEKDAIGLEKLDALRHSAPASAVDLLQPLEIALENMPALAVSAAHAVRIVQGQAVAAPHTTDADPIWAASDGCAVAIGRVRDETFYPVRVLAVQ